MTMADELIYILSIVNKINRLKLEKKRFEVYKQTNQNLSAKSCFPKNKKMIFINFGDFKQTAQCTIPP